MIVLNMLALCIKDEVKDVSNENRIHQDQMVDLRSTQIHDQMHIPEVFFLSCFVLEVKAFN